MLRRQVIIKPINNNLPGWYYFVLLSSGLKLRDGIQSLYAQLSCV